MYTIKCYKECGLMHAYEAGQYTYDPNSEPPCITADTFDFALFISRHPGHYQSIFISNADGKTVDAYRAKEDSCAGK